MKAKLTYFTMEGLVYTETEFNDDKLIHPDGMVNLIKKYKIEGRSLPDLLNNKHDLDILIEMEGHPLRLVRY